MWLELSGRMSRGSQGQMTDDQAGCSEDLGFPSEGGGNYGTMLSRGM